jgi:hypothetical protein
MPLHLPDPERDAFAGGQAPAPHLDMLHAAGFRAAGAALRLGVFDGLAGGALTAKQLASSIGCDEHALGILLGSLAPFGYVDVAPGDGEPRYGNSAAATAFLLSSTPDSYATVFSFWHTVLTRFWDGLEESVRTGVPTRAFYPWLEHRPDTLREFQTMLARLSRMFAPHVVELVPVPDRPARLLDVGGGHAGYSIAFCQRHIRLRATVADLAGALATGMREVERAGLGGRVEGAEWDLTSGTPVPGGPYDVVLLFNIVHGLTPESSVALLRALAAAMPAGATVALLEPLDDPAPSGSVTGDAFVKLFSLNLFHGQGGRAYPLDQIAGWLRAAGFGDIRDHGLPPSPNDRLIVATRL